MNLTTCMKWEGLTLDVWFNNKYATTRVYPATIGASISEITRSDNLKVQASGLDC
ncbi:hypothetical protein ACJX0J_028553, partial [Zea mays]